MDNFKAFNLPHSLQDALDNMKLTTPTEIQAKAIPIIIEGKDVIGTAQTGTGKTLAFGIPLALKIITSSYGATLVLLPTRELALQVETVIKKLLQSQQEKSTALLIGGENISSQFRQLNRKPRIIIGTPGRVNDHLRRGSLKFKNTDLIVIDEVDRMLDMGFEVQIEEIFRHLPEKRQVLMFSATLPPNILRLTKKYMNDPVRVIVGRTNTPPVALEQKLVYTTNDKKYGDLLTELENREGSIVVFVKTKNGAERLTKKLEQHKHLVNAIHGGLRQGKRNRVVSDFRNQKYRIMVATDIASRGLDIPHIQHIINYDLPECAEDYVHRIGRTARTGRSGQALNFITPQDNKKWKSIHRLISNKADNNN